MATLSFEIVFETLCHFMWNTELFIHCGSRLKTTSLIYQQLELGKLVFLFDIA